MDYCIDSSYKSLNKKGEELCGDKVEFLKLSDSDVVILSDGMGSGVKANILATLTSRILKTMFAKGASIDMGVETILKTLPICQVRKVAYSTFSIVQIFHNGDAYIAEYDSPACIFIRDDKIVDLPFVYREIEGKSIRECRLKVQPKDCFIIMSDGVIFAGAGDLMNLSWTRENVAEYALKCIKKSSSAAAITAMLSDACYDLYEGKPEDDTTVSVIRIKDRKIINIFTGPPENKEDDDKIMKDFMSSTGAHIICGGTTAQIASRYLKVPIENCYDGTKEVPPTSMIKGIDLVTEGVLTMNKALELLIELGKDEPDVKVFLMLDENNGASKLANMIFSDCTDINFFVGKAANEANQLMFDISMRNSLVSKLVDEAVRLGKNVNVQYY